ncbi:HNH endonuclease signature motif containing protein [Blastococcus sp. TF02A-26]|uniref:HNH endonuclease signature motif containing protein n=1 Tax=Blastococcus sp. TF02A-26 TaxID=2250577 RepID=UPI000DE86355|nr:HNH endonuclease signature motif containing protein [Blastococcus sp. TF02A-26]RBY83325.1 HNH endonuclease [Blastococcus sp. TF02A-26]
MEIGTAPPPRVSGVPVPVLPGEVVSAALADLDLAAEIWSTDAHMAREHAMQAAVIAELARRRAVSRDADPGAGGGPGPDTRAVRPVALADVSDDFVTELAVIRGCSDGEASKLAAEALLLTGKLAATWSELWAGRITIRKARILLDLLGDASDAVAAYVQERVLPAAETCDPSRLADRARYHLYRADAAARDRRRREAERRADIHVERTADGLGRLVIDDPLPLVHAARDALGQHARWLRADGDERPIGVLRSATAFDLILRPWDTSRPPVTAQLVIHAAIGTLRGDAGAPPAELDGQVITAAQCRQVLAELDLLDLADPPAGGSVLISLDDPATARTVAVATRAELARAAGTGRRVRRRGADRGLTDGPGLRPPPPTTAYRPTAAQRRLVTTRDRTCRMPGCRRRTGSCDIDHVTAHADGGPTTCTNLCCLCRRHHRIKTFARGWAFTLLPDGRLVVRTPSGVTRTTRPPGWAHDPEPDPPWLDETAPPDPQQQ